MGEDAAGPLYPAFARRHQVGALLGGFVGVGVGWWWTAGDTLLVGGVLYALAGVMLLFTMTEHGFAPAPREERATWRAPFRQAGDGLRVARSRPVVVTALLTALLMGASSESFDRLWGFHLIDSFGLPDVMSETLFFGLVQLVAQLGSIAALRIAQSRTDFTRSGSVAVKLIASNVVVIAAMCLFAGAPFFAVALVGAWITFWARAVEEPFATAWVNRGLPSATRATVLSTMGQSNALGQIVGGPLFGLLAALAGVRVSIAAAAVVLVPAVALYWRHRGVAADDPAEVAT